MEFRILGPFEAWRAGSLLEVRGPIGRRLLALLLVEPGRSTSMAWLIEGLWEGTPPQTASRQVQNAAARLRKVLGPSRLVSEGDGYRLDTTDTTIDSVRFEETLRRSRRVAAAGNKARAATMARSGLDLWRGGALVGLPGRYIEAKADRLEEARLSAIEDCIGWELDIGASSQVINELRHLVSVHPYRQKVTRLLMLALHRDGRTGEAFGVFEQLRSRLANDLGLDPDPLVRELYTAIQRGDVEPSTPKPSVVRLGRAEAERRILPGTPGPAQLPVSPGGFVGRGAQVEVLDRVAEETGRHAVCVIAGAAGVGKSALAIHWAHRVRSRFPDGQLFINLRGFDQRVPVTAREALSRFIRSLQYPGAPVPDDMDEAAELYRSLLDGKRVLVVLDNATEMAQIRPLLPANTSCSVVVTSRNRLTDLCASEAAHSIELAPLDRIDAVDLLAAAVGGDRLHTDPAATHRLAELCGDLPLALRIAGAHLTHHPEIPIADYAAGLDGVNRLDVLAIEGDVDVAVAAALDASLRALDSGSQALFLQLGLVPGDDFPYELAATVAEASGLNARQALDRLQSAHLVESHQPGRYRMHDLTREFAYRRAVESSGSIDIGRVRDLVIDWYYEYRFDQLTENHVNIVAAWHQWHDAERSWKLMSVLTIMASAGRDASAIEQHVDQRLEQAMSRDDETAVQALYNVKAEALTRAGDFDGSLTYARMALKSGLDPTGYFEACLAIALWSGGTTTDAAHHFEKSIDKAKAAGNEYVMLTSAQNLGITYRIGGRYAQSEAVLVEALSRNMRHRFPSVTFATEMALVKVYIDTGQTEQAHDRISAYLASVDLLQPGQPSLALLLRAQIHIQRRDFEAALVDLRDALEDSERNYTVSVSRTIDITMSNVLCSLGRYHEAQDHLDSIDVGMAQRQVEFQFDLVAARVRNGLGEFAIAKTAAQFVCAGYTEQQRPRLLAQALLILADAHTGLGEHDSAENCRREALELFTEIGVPEAEEVRRLVDGSAL